MRGCVIIGIVFKHATYSVIFTEPISCQYGEVSSRRRERYWDNRAACDFDATKPSCSLVEAKGRKVEVTTNLIFDLENISEVLSWWNGAICAKDPILP